MGQYWKLLNVTKKQYLHPHQLNCGLKFSEWADYYSRVIERARALVAAGHWSREDELRVVSDYGQDRELVDLDKLAFGPNVGEGDDSYPGLYDAEDVSLEPILPEKS